MWVLLEPAPVVILPSWTSFQFINKNIFTRNYWFKQSYQFTACLVSFVFCFVFFTLGVEELTESLQRDHTNSMQKGHRQGAWTRDLINQSKGWITAKGISKHFTQSKRKQVIQPEQHKWLCPAGKKKKQKTLSRSQLWRARVSSGEKETEWQAGQLLHQCVTTSAVKRWNWHDVTFQIQRSSQTWSI